MGSSVVRVPGSAAEAEQMAIEALSFLVAESPGALDAAGQADRLRVFEQIARRASAGQAAALSTFAGGAGFEGEGCRSVTGWQTVRLG